MTTPVKSGVTTLPTVDYCAAMLAPLTVVASTAGALGIRPAYMQVNLNQYHELVDGRPWHVTVQVEDVYDADLLAAHYELPADSGVDRNYTRSGVVVVDGVGEVGVRVYTGRPVPTFPAGYAPVAVTA